MERKNGVPSSGSVVSFESSCNPRKEEKVTKSEFVDQVASESGLSKGEATKAVDATLTVIEETLKRGGEINFTGFGKFSVADRDRNFNLKLAASKINGYVLKPGETWSFNGVVGERSQATGYKIAHVITAGGLRRSARYVIRVIRESALLYRPRPYSAR